jgi:hypothetical protein
VAVFLFNTYRGWVPLIIADSKEILYSKEGVAQGDPLSMFAYAVATIPLINQVGHPRDGSEIWYADDASACAQLRNLRDWFVRLQQIGPSFGYYPEPSKCVIIVNSALIPLAHMLFDQFGVKITTSHRFLGGVVGDDDGSSSFVKSCVEDRLSLVENLVSIAASQPQLAYSAFTRSVQSKWMYVQRVVPDCGHLFESLEHFISERFIPTIFGSEISPSERILFTLPARMGGLNILNPTVNNQLNYTTSRRLTLPIVSAIKGSIIFDFNTISAHYHSIQEDISNEKLASFESLFNNILTQLNESQRRAVNRAKDEKMSSWLTVAPVRKHHFDLTAQEFRDALALRYRKPLLSIPSSCDGCGADIVLSHALSCRFGGLVTQRHNEVRDTFGDLASLAWGQVIKEPIVRDANNSSDTPALVADLSIRGVWIPQAEALFDIRVTDTDAQSYRNLSPSDVLSTAENEKKKKYLDACTIRRATFTPLCISVDGMLGREANVFVKRTAEMLSLKWGTNYCQILGSEHISPLPF